MPALHHTRGRRVAKKVLRPVGSFMARTPQSPSSAGVKAFRREGVAKGDAPTPSRGFTPLPQGG